MSAENLPDWGSSMHSESRFGKLYNGQTDLLGVLQSEFQGKPRNLYIWDVIDAEKAAMKAEYDLFPNLLQRPSMN